MIDTQFNVRRYVSEYSIESEKLVAEHQLLSFNLAEFQKEFAVQNLSSPMFDSFEITEANVVFINRFLKKEIVWDFLNSSFFVEANAI